MEKRLTVAELQAKIEKHMRASQECLLGQRPDLAQQHVNKAQAARREIEARAKK